MNKFSLSLLLLLFFELHSINIFAQTNENTHISLENDSNTFRSHFLNAQWQLHSRTFFMSTINEGILKDDYTMATGAGIGILTDKFHGFQLGINGFFIFELFSSNIATPDSSTGIMNRYELGLYDVTQPGNYQNLSRLEELYLKYSVKNISLIAGRFNINTPFINIQDGRMRPTLEQGVWTNFKLKEKFLIQAGWITHVLPRSTMQWYNMGKSLGVYSVGINEQGTKSGYKGKVSSGGLGILNLNFKNQTWDINIWDGYFSNVINTAIVELKHVRLNKKETLHIYHGLMFMHQDATGNGGNNNAALAYIQKGSQSNVISAKVGFNNKKVDMSINYTRITGDGRYLMPREWGREFFYTFMPRERNEGAGDVHALMAKMVLSPTEKFKTTFSYGFVDMPDVKNYRLNKYELPSYHQINFETNYVFSKFLKGFEVRALFAYKINAGETYGNLKYNYNKTDMLNSSVVLDFKI